MNSAKNPGRGDAPFDIAPLHGDLDDDGHQDGAAGENRRLKDLLASVAQATWSAEPDGRFTSDGRAWRRYTGLQEHEWREGGWLASVDPREADRVASAWRAGLATREPFQLECRIRHASGEWRWTRVHAVPERDLDGSVRAWSGIHLDVTEPHRVRASLRESELRYEKLTEASRAGIVVLVHGLVVHANAAAAPLLGAAQALHLIGRPWTEFVDPDDAETFERLGHVALVGRSDAPVVARWSRRTEGREAEIAATTVDWRGEPAVQLVIRDASERVHRERHAALMGELAIALDDAADVPAIAHASAELLHRRLGALVVEIEELDGRGTLHRWSAPDSVAPRAALPSTRAWARAPTIEGPWAHVPLMNGFRRRQRISAARPPTHEWRPEDLATLADAAARIGLAIDRAHGEAALRASESRLQAMFATASIGLCEVTVDGRFARVNDALCEMLGRSRDDLLARGVRDVTHPDDVAASFAALASVFATGEAVTVDKRYVRRDGVAIWAISSITRVTGDGLGPPSAFVVTVDITDRRSAITALREADRRKDEFLATLAHELRNPLAPIRNAVQILDSGELKPRELALCREIIKRQAQHMAWLLDDLLDVSRVTRGKLQLRRERLDVREVVESAVETTRPLMTAQRHEFVVRLPDEPAYLEADRVRISQVITNLLTNAAKYTNPGGRVELAVERAGPEVRISVRDDGIGLAPPDLDRVFDMFSQVDAALDRAQGGLGIGLALVRGIVELHGGHVQARSEGIGRGAEFVVWLPAADAPSARTAPAPAAGTFRTRRRILVADDNRDAARTLEVVLRFAGHDVRIAHDGLSALAIGEEFQPEIVLLDIGMPGLNGYQTARRLRAEPWGRDVLLVALTGWGQASDRELAKSAGFDQHVTKPTDPARIVDLVAAHSPAEKPAE
jgi:PAS domain S-box-containing protein